MARPATNRGVPLVVLVVCQLTTGAVVARGQDCAQVVARFRQSSVSLQIEAVDKRTGAIRRGGGSGIIVSDKGHVLTNRHVVQPGDEFIDVLVVGSIGSRTSSPIPMRVIDTEPTHDLALLQFNNTGLSYQPARVGSIETVNTGSTVCSFGYPLDIEFRPTSGMLGTASGPGGWWTLDVATNPGESGAPVFTTSGDLVGLRVGGRNDAVGIYYMVPVNLAARLLAIVPKLPGSRPLLDGRVAQARSAIVRALHFPAAVQTSRTPPTMTQGILINTAPLRLYEVLSRYDDIDFGQIPEVGAVLQSFFGAYYDFEQTTAALELEALDRIGKTVKVRFIEGWRIYLRYVLLRFSGRSAEQMSSGNNFLNYEITWSDAERVHNEIAQDSPMRRRFSVMFLQHQAFIQALEQLKGVLPQEK